jgi:hypothetical protein
MSIPQNPFAARMLPLMLFGYVLLCGSRPAVAQSTCASNGYRVLARRWDAVLGRGWELRQDCAHPEWPAHAVAVNVAGPQAYSGTPAQPFQSVSQLQLVHAGEPVRLWLQDATVRIEMSGVAEQSGRGGDRVIVRISRQTDENGLTVGHFAGIVRGAGDVEMEP